MIRLKNILLEELVYHATTKGTDLSVINFDKLSSNSLLSGFGIHFGTKEAASHRMKSQHLDSIQVYELDTSAIAAINNPIKEEEFAYLLYKASKKHNHPHLPELNDIKQHPLGIMTQYYKGRPELYKEAARSIIATLSKMGYTGIAYINKTENAGNISYVVFDSAAYKKIDELFA